MSWRSEHGVDHGSWLAQRGRVLVPGSFGLLNKGNVEFVRNVEQFASTLELCCMVCLAVLVRLCLTSALRVRLSNVALLH